ncbi:MAG: formate-dependent phosphoribosylglycinamide formyltransferase [Candidatus Kapabacteria bacterium]|nr:formate-dependent phosphoribosylglycinamide formyltransferase [Ignavibacteria bacterium]MBL0320932.1 formate-dependent phosphoribosylglycinamide formyltransferase [Ignavibacteria bacterium]MBP6510925.1 formate-dependent phosphoribosylglycinamide formyltransferase [Candidatus Kapabacteria bacterium]
MKTILLLGSGELGKEFVIAVKRYGHRVVAADSYDNAPAMQVADERRVVNMLDGEALDAVVAEVKPDIIVPEIEAIRTERLFDYEARGIHVVPSARAANMTMNRKAIRDLASQELGLKTARYMYASTEEQFVAAVQEIGIPCVVKPLMSSSGKGQSIVRTAVDVQRSWTYAMEGSRGDLKEVIVEEFIPFDSEITLLTVTQRNGHTLFCPPIGHRQERGDYMESWMPHAMRPELLEKAQDMAAKVTASLTGSGIWGVEFFLTADDVYFSELSPRPHDTGMVTLAPTTNLNEFELHARAVLGYPIPGIVLEHAGASAVILATEASALPPTYSGIETALSMPEIEIRVFGKPSTRPYRRMAVALANGAPDSDVDALRAHAKTAADCISVITARS